MPPEDAVEAALARIEETNPATGRLLRERISTGIYCQYRPDPARPVHWQTPPVVAENF